MEAINYTTKLLNRFSYLSKPMKPLIIQNISYVYKENVKYDKNQRFFTFFCEKPVSKQVES